MEINLTNIFENFFFTKVFVVLLLCIFTCLLSLRLDNILTCSYWLIFTPLWIWKLAAVLGVIIGTISWRNLSDRRFEPEMFIQYKSMVLSFSTNIMLFIFELTVCEKLESNNILPWTFCFLPLYLLALVSIATILWSIKYSQSYEIELFCSINLLQFVFIALRLDFNLTWSWVYILSPTWLIMFLSLISLIYLLIYTIIQTRKYNASTRRLSNSLHDSNTPAHNIQINIQTKWLDFIYYTLLVFSVLAFEILLCIKLDQDSVKHWISFFRKQFPNSFPTSYKNEFLSRNEISNYFQRKLDSKSEPFSSLSFVAVFSPLYITYFVLILLSFKSRCSNIWWFGIGQRDFCRLFLFICPIFQVYGNINLKFNLFDSSSEINQSTNNQQISQINSSDNSFVLFNQDVFHTPEESLGDSNSSPSVQTNSSQPQLSNNCAKSSKDPTSMCNFHLESLDFEQEKLCLCNDGTHSLILLDVPD